MRKEIKDILDEESKLQNLINSEAWSKDIMGTLASQAIRLCLAAGATESEAYEYLIIT